jgi:hypothetical protein
LKGSPFQHFQQQKPVSTVRKLEKAAENPMPDNQLDIRPDYASSARLKKDSADHINKRDTLLPGHFFHQGSR